jgi:ornithine carbamoyltransferase
LKGKDLLSISDLTPEEVPVLISDALDLKNDGWSTLLEGKIIALVFEKPSLRTRVSFEVAMRQLGGQVLYLSPAEIGLGKREPAADVARVLSRYLDAIVARTFAHETLTSLAKYASIPIINALSDWEHPCQALADLMTVFEHKHRLQGVELAYIGDGNNVANSLLLACAMTGVNFRIAAPQGYMVPETILSLAQEYARFSGAVIRSLENPTEAVNGADVVYTDVWTSMGQEAESEERRRIFAAYQLNPELLSGARPDAIIMHPLPAHYGEEVSPGLLDSERSVVFDQAENRMHVEKAVLAQLLGGLDIPLPCCHR